VLRYTVFFVILFIFASRVKKNKMHKMNVIKSVKKKTKPSRVLFKTIVSFEITVTLKHASSILLPKPSFVICNNCPSLILAKTRFPPLLFFKWNISTNLYGNINLPTPVPLIKSKDFNPSHSQSLLYIPFKSFFWTTTNKIKNEQWICIIYNRYLTCAFFTRGGHHFLQGIERL